MARRRPKEAKRTAVLATVAFLVVLGLMVADFVDNGRIDNGRFMIVALFVFSGAGAGRAIDAVVDWYIEGRRHDDP